MSERGDCTGFLVGAVDDTAASELRRHFLGDFFDDIEVDAEPLRCTQFQSSSSSSLVAG